MTAAPTAPAPTGVAKKKKRAKKDPNAPKRPLSAYMFFARDKREEIIGKKPELKANVAEVGRQIGAAWNSMPPDEKAPYETQAEGDKRRYEKQMQEYRKS